MDYYTCTTFEFTAHQWHRLSHIAYHHDIQKYHRSTCRSIETKVQSVHLSAAIVPISIVPIAATSSPITHHMPADNHVFATLDPVQRYALGNLCIVLLHHPAVSSSPSASSASSAAPSSSAPPSSSSVDMNALAFARNHSLNILEALDLRPGQKQAILALNPTVESRDHVIEQCVNLIGDLPHRLHAMQALLALSVASGLYDARSRAFLSEVAMHFGIAWPAIAAIELTLAAHLFHSQTQTHSQPNSTSNSLSKQVIDIDKHIAPYFSPEPVPTNSVQNFQPDANNHNNYDNDNDNDNAQCLSRPDHQPQQQSVGNPFGSSSCEVPASSAITTPSIYDIDEDDSSLPSIDKLKSKRRRQKQRVRKAMKIGGITLVGGVLFGLTGGLIAPALLTALAGVGVTSAAGLAASGSLASGAVVGSLFGVAGGGFTLRKARNRISTNLDEFDFERPDDERVLAARAEKEAKQKKDSENKQPGSDDADETQDKVLAIEYETSTTTTACQSKEDINASTQENNVNNNEDLSDSDVEVDVDMEKELPNPVSVSSNSTDEDVKQNPSQLQTSKKKKKNSKLKVGARGLEAVANIPSLHLCICVPAWLGDREYGSALEQFEPGLQAELPYSQHLALRWESRRLYEMGLAFAKFWASKATITTIQQAYPHALAAASSVAGAVAFAFAVPLTVMSAMDYIDNPWSILVSRSNGAGEELANVLVERSYGGRPVSLFGYSVGARVIFKALEWLAERKALGIVQDVFLMGAPVTADPERWLTIRPVVAGRLVNAYMNYDWALAFLHRGCGHGVYVSGLRKVDTACVENLNLAYLGIEGHQELNNGIFRAMHAMGVGLGYITMPPAKLVIKGGGKIGVLEPKVVCEEPGGSEWAVDPEEAEREEAEREEEEDTKHGRGEDEENVDQDGNLKNNEDLLSKQKQKSKSKSKSRKPWGWWYSSSSKGSSRSGNTKSNPDANPNRNRDFDSNGDMGIDVNSSVVAESTDTAAIPGPSAVTLTNSTNGNTALTASSTSDVGVSQSQEVTETSEAKDNEFDWELQRRIWEEQERQISERGYEYADSARVVALQGRVMLDLSVEVAGRRLERLIAQDSILPVSTRTQVFTNCVDSQRGMQIRIYEHYSRTKSVSSNMPKWEKTHVYPKVLADLELRLQKAKPKGSLRVQVGLSMDDDGNLHVTAHEFFDKQGKVGERVSAVVERAKLCSVEERVELEAKEAEKRRREREKARLAIEAPVDPAQQSEKVPESVS